jgi:replicative DNA helicase
MYPQNTDLEKSVLGCLLLGKLDRIIELQESDFLNDANKLVYKAIVYMAVKKIAVDEISLSDLLKKRMDNSLEYVTSLASYVATPENISHYIESLQMYTMRREVIKAADKAKEAALVGEYESPVSFKSDIQQMFDIRTREKKSNDCKIGSILKKVVDDMGVMSNSKDDGKLFTGYYDLDRITAGFHPEELTLIAARPGVGKTAFALQILIKLAQKGNNCLFVSREMSDTQIGKRILSSLSEVDGQKMRLCKSLETKDWQKIEIARVNAETLPIEINDKLSTVQEIRAYCRELKNNTGLDILILDYLQLCKSMKKTENRRQEVEDISRQLKEMSLEFGIPVIALSQLSRESKNADEPELHHLRESGSLEQDADNVIFLHVPEGTNEQAEFFEIKVIVSKQRNGPTGFIFLRYYRRTFKLCNLL